LASRVDEVAMTNQAHHELPRYEIEVIPGLEEFASQEIRQTFRLTGGPDRLPKEGRLSLLVKADLPRLNQLRSVVAVHAVELFDLPRPKALLGHQNLERLLGVARGILSAHPAGTFNTFRISAAGADSPVFARLKAEIAAQLALTNNDREGDLLLTVRRTSSGQSGWEILIRTSPRPLAARSWRVCDLPGALNASVANVMVMLAKPRGDDVFVNVCCGSGTLMIERLRAGPARSVTGYDVDRRALDCAQENLKAGGHADQAQLVLHDARHLPLSAGSATTLVADLPYAMLVGSVADNRSLYPEILNEAARVAHADASFVLITTQRQLMAEILEYPAQQWRCVRTIPIKIPFQRGFITPSIYLLRRVTPFTSRLPPATGISTSACDNRSGC
jgi:tRNA (guanine6-N2)-methyltransferase